jgi:hypothetical protein
VPALRPVENPEAFATPGTWIAYVGVALRPPRASHERDVSDDWPPARACLADLSADASQLLFPAASPAA